MRRRRCSCHAAISSERWPWAASPPARLGFPHIARAATVKVGAALPFSGGLELFGEQARLGLDLAAAEINAAGGILGQQVEIVYEDNKTDPKTSNERARKLIQSDEVIAVTGPITSAARDAMAGTMERFKTPLLYATNYEGGGCNRYLFFFNTVPNQDAAPLIRYMNGRFGTSYYMFGADYVWPRKMFEASRAVIDELGGTILGEEYVPLFTVKDYASIIKKIADSGAEILVFALPGVDGVTFIRQAEEFGLLQKLTVGFLGFTETYLGAFGEGKGEGMYACVPFVASDPAPGVQDFVGRIRAMHGRGHRGLVLRHDPLRRADGAQGRPREVGRGLARGGGRRHGRPDLRGADRHLDDHGRGPPLGAQHVHLEDGGRPDQRGRASGPDRAGQAVRVGRRALSA